MRHLFSTEGVAFALPKNPEEAFEVMADIMLNVCFVGRKAGLGSTALLSACKAFRDDLSDEILRLEKQQLQTVTAEKT